MKLFLLTLTLLFIHSDFTTLDASSDFVLLKSDQMVFDLNANEFIASKNVRITYNKFGIDAQKAVYHIPEKTFDILGKTQVNFPEGILKTDSLRFKLMDQIINGENPVWSKFRDYYLNAGGIQFNIKDNTALFTNKPSIDDGGKRISGDNILVDIDNKSIQLKGNSKIDSR